MKCYCLLDNMVALTARAKALGVVHTAVNSEES